MTPEQKSNLQVHGPVLNQLLGWDLVSMEGAQLWDLNKDMPFRVVKTLADGFIWVGPGPGRQRIWRRGDTPVHYVPNFYDIPTLALMESMLRAKLGGRLCLYKGNGWWQIETEDGSWDGDTEEDYIVALFSVFRRCFA